VRETKFLVSKDIILVPLMDKNQVTPVTLSSNRMDLLAQHKCLTHYVFDSGVGLIKCRA